MSHKLIRLKTSLKRKKNKHKVKSMAKVSQPLTSFLMGATLLLSACVSPIAVTDTQTPQALQKSTYAYVNADVGQGTKTPAKLSFQINLSELSGFSKQEPTPGATAKTKADLSHIRFYLIESTTGLAPTSLSGTGFIYAVQADNRLNKRVDITFINVAANSDGKSYYVAAAGFDSETTIAAHNITHLGAPFSDETEGKYFVSNSGGDSGSPGCVRVSPVSYALSSLTALAVPLNLLDVVSPWLDSGVNITSDDEIDGNPIGSGN